MYKSLMRYHPRIGFTFMPSAKLRMPFMGGGYGYLVRTNAAGYRSDREFVQERAPGRFRALLFGDSQTAGDGVANALRYSDLLEKALPGLEVYNYGLSASGPDQHFLAYQDNAVVEHDLLVLALFVPYIGRVNSRLTRYLDTNGEVYLRAKPYFQIEDRELVLHNVPVPKQVWTKQTLPAEYLPHIYPPDEQCIVGVPDGTLVVKPRTVFHMIRARLSRVPALYPLKRAVRAVKTVLMRFKRFQIGRDYDAPEGPRWLLLRKILETWIGASRTPVLLVPIPDLYLVAESADLSHYEARLRELAEGTGCNIYDPLPDLLKLTAEERGALWFRGHLSARGHEAIARLLVPIFED